MSKWISRQRLYLFFNSHQEQQKFAVIFSNWIHDDKTDPAPAWKTDCFNHEIKSTANYVSLIYDTTLKLSPAHSLIDMLFHNGLKAAILITSLDKDNHHYFLEGKRVDRNTLIKEKFVSVHLMDYLLRAESEEKVLNQAFSFDPHYFLRENARQQNRYKKIIYITVLAALIIISFLVRVMFVYLISRK